MPVQFTSSFYLCEYILCFVKFCYHCGNRLPLGAEKYCPECGEGLTLESMDGSSSSMGTMISGSATHIAETSGDVIGSTTSGMGNIIGKEVAYSVSGSVINLQVNSISAEILQELKDILSRSMQVETKGDFDQRLHNINPKLDAKANEAKVTKEVTQQVLKDIDKIGKEKGVHIEQLKAGDIQVSRTELLLNDIVSKGNMYFDSGEYSKAIECYDDALGIDERYALAWINKGASFRELGRYNEAIQCYDKGLEIDESDTLPWNNRGFVLYNLGRYDEAIESYIKALEIDEKFVTAWTNKGVALNSLSRYTEAIEQYDKALKIDQKNSNAWYYKGVALNSLGRYDEAIACYDKALEIDKNNALAWSSKSLAFDKLGKHGDAKKCFDMAKRLA
jgi:tetratricopeptide (TPR) repeat protein